MGNGNIGGWASALTGAGCSDVVDDDDTCTTSTSFWAVCAGWDDGTAVDPDCNSWPGVINEGIGVSMCIELDVPTMEDVGWGAFWYSKFWLETVFGLETGGTIALIAELEVIRGESDGKLVFGVATGRAALGALLGNELGNVSKASVAEGTGGREDDKIDDEVDGSKELGVKLWELAPVGSKGDGASGKFEPWIFEDPVGKGALKLEYCIGCCIEGGMDSPGGGRSKDCWCKGGSPFWGGWP